MAAKGVVGITPMDRVRWARVIAARRAEQPPVEWKEIAREVGLGVRMCQKLLKQLQQSGDPDSPVDPMKVIQRWLDVLETTMEEAAATYAAAPEGSAVRVGALKLFKESYAEQVAVMQRAGFLPAQLGALSAERQLQEIFRAFMDAMRRYPVPDELLTEMQHLAEAGLMGRQPIIEGRAALSGG